MNELFGEIESDGVDQLADLYPESWPLRFYFNMLPPGSPESKQMKFIVDKSEDRNTSFEDLAHAFWEHRPSKSFMKSFFPIKEEF